MEQVPEHKRLQILATVARALSDLPMGTFPPFTPRMMDWTIRLCICVAGTPGDGSRDNKLAKALARLVAGAVVCTTQGSVGKAFSALTGSVGLFRDVANDGPQALDGMLGGVPVVELSDVAHRMLLWMLSLREIPTESLSEHLQRRLIQNTIKSPDSDPYERYVSLTDAAWSRDSV